MPKLPRHMRWRKGVIYVYPIGQDGRRAKERSTGSADLEVAKALKRKWDIEATDPGAAAAKAYTVSAAIADFAKKLDERVVAGDLSTTTRAFYVEKLGHWIGVFENTLERGAVCESCEEDDFGICPEHYRPRSFAEINEGGFDHYISERRTDGVRDITIKKELGPMLAVVKRAKRKGKWRGDIDTLVPDDFSPKYVPRKRALEVDEVQKLIGQLIPDQAAQVAYMVATSAELSAVGRALAVDIPDGVELVTVRGSKNENRWRQVPVVHDWQRALLRFARKHGNGDRGMLFRPWHSDHRILTAACKRAKIDRCSFNDLRRTFAHWMRRELVRIEHIAPMMGHSTTAMLERVYAKLEPAELLEITRGATPVPQTQRTEAETMDTQQTTDAGKSRVWRGQRDLNPRPSDSKSVSLFIPEPRYDNEKLGARSRRAAPVPQAAAGGVLPFRLTRTKKRTGPAS